MHTGKEPLALVGTLAELRTLDATPEPESQGARTLAPCSHGARRGLLGRLARSTWAPVLGRGAAILAGLLLFAGVGIYSTRAHPGGVHVASQVAPGAPVNWLEPTKPTGEGPPLASAQQPVASASHAPAGLVGLLEAQPCSTPGALCEKDRKNEPSPGLTADGKVILNVAGAEILTRLPGVGARRAEAIVKLRERLKRFRRTTDLLRVRGIGVRSLKRMLPHLVLDPPPDTKPGEEEKQAPARPHAPD